MLFTESVRPTSTSNTYWGKGGAKKILDKTTEGVRKVFSGEEKIKNLFKRAPAESQGEFKSMGDTKEGVFESGLKEKQVQEKEIKLGGSPKESYCMIRKTETVVPYGVSAYDPSTHREVEKIPRGTTINMKRGDSIRTITLPSGKKEAYVYIIGKSDTTNPYAPYTDSCRLLVRSPWLDAVVNQPLSAESLSKAVIAYAQMRAKEIERDRQILLQEQKQGKSIQEIKGTDIFQSYSKKIERSKSDGVLPLIQLIQKNGYNTNTTITYSGEFKEFLKTAKSSPGISAAVQRIASGIQNGDTI